MYSTHAEDPVWFCSSSLQPELDFRNPQYMANWLMLAPTGGRRSWKSQPIDALVALVQQGCDFSQLFEN